MFVFACGSTAAIRFSGRRVGGSMVKAKSKTTGTTLFTSLRIDREYMFAGLFYAVEGMRVGGRRKIRVAPHLAYGEEGVPDVIPGNALLTVEVTVLSERTI
jgi:FKBP-type peptidyl-prolyl cis-trans isomerase